MWKMLFRNTRPPANVREARERLSTVLSEFDKDKKTIEAVYETTTEGNDLNHAKATRELRMSQDCKRREINFLREWLVREEHPRAPLHESPPVFANILTIH